MITALPSPAERTTPEGTMSTDTLLCILLLLFVTEVCMEVEYYDDDDDLEPTNCSTTETIRGGSVSYSQGGLEGSVLTYHCPHGYDPYPVSDRVCDEDGDWSVMLSPSRRAVTRATCKEKMCSGQLQLDNGDFWPRDQWFRLGTTQSFSCLAGFTLYGSQNRTCTLSQEWTGASPICDNNVDACKDPGIPPGALRTGSRFQVGDTVSYRCSEGLDLLGSSELVCLHSREWTGSSPRCQAYNAFDSPSAVAASLSGSLSGVMEALSPEFQKNVAYGRTIDVEDDSRLNIFILLDTSGSVASHFEASRNATISLIRKLDSFDVQMKFHVTSFASQAIDIVFITDTFTSTHAGLVIKSIQDFNPNVHMENTATNLHAALWKVNEMMAILKEDREDNHFMETQNVIIIITDGYSNKGPDPKTALIHIRNHLNYSNTFSDHTAEKLLDVYVFGVGKDIAKKNLNEIASKKKDEKHVFIMKDVKSLEEVFNQMINIQTTTKCGVAQEEIPDPDEPEAGLHTKPWHVALSVPVSEGSRPALIPCYGSVVSPNWILTAAHCFGRSSAKELSKEIDVTWYFDEDRSHTVKIRGKIFIHQDYNVEALKDRNVPEFYDYDVALVEVNSSTPLFKEARPICLPCTTAANRAMRRVKSTCKQHRDELLPHKETLASFINKRSERVETLIHTGEQRQACVSKAAGLLTDSKNVTLDEFIPDRFLCTGGSSTFKNSVSCKGDSGGSLFLRNKMRYFQVGVLSWGSVDKCGGSSPNTNQRQLPVADARDFHISLFTILPWLKQHLGQELDFLPLED